MSAPRCASHDKRMILDLGLDWLVCFLCEHGIEPDLRKPPEANTDPGERPLSKAMQDDLDDLAEHERKERRWKTQPAKGSKEAE
jgi:hypothetical protein